MKRGTRQRYVRTSSHRQIGSASNSSRAGRFLTEKRKQIKIHSVTIAITFMEKNLLVPF